MYVQDGGAGRSVGYLAVVFERLRDQGLVASGTETVMLDSTSVKVHTDGTGNGIRLVIIVIRLRKCPSPLYGMPVLC